VPLFRDLAPEQKQSTTKEVNRQQAFVLNVFEDVAKRAVQFLILILSISIVTLILAGTHYAYNSVLLMLANITLLIGILCVGILFAINHQSLLDLTWKFALARFNILNSQVDVDILNSLPQRPRMYWLPIAAGFSAFGLWIVGAILAILAFSIALPKVEIPIGARIASRPAAETTPLTSRPIESRPAQQAASTRAALALADEIALGLFVATFIQAIALIWTVVAAGNTSKRQLRAYVSPHTYDLISGSTIKPPKPEFADDPCVILQIRNGGQTPAYRVETHAQVAVIEPTNESLLTVPPMAGVQYAVLGPDTMSHSVRRLGRNLTAEEITAITTGAKAIYLYGRVQYYDAFKKRRFTSFRMRYSGQWPLTDSATMSFATGGNAGD
jgi:hypothetical protein